MVPKWLAGFEAAGLAECGLKSRLCWGSGFVACIIATCCPMTLLLVELTCCLSDLIDTDRVEGGSGLWLAVIRLQCWLFMESASQEVISFV
jgi:hypothetical protein